MANLSIHKDSHSVHLKPDQTQTQDTEKPKSKKQIVYCNKLTRINAEYTAVFILDARCLKSDLFCAHLCRCRFSKVFSLPMHRRRLKQITPKYGLLTAVSIVWSVFIRTQSYKTDSTVC